MTSQTTSPPDGLPNDAPSTLSGPGSIGVSSTNESNGIVAPNSPTPCSPSNTISSLVNPTRPAIIPPSSSPDNVECTDGTSVIAALTRPTDVSHLKHDAAEKSTATFSACRMTLEQHRLVSAYISSTDIPTLPSYKRFTSAGSMNKHIGNHLEFLLCSTKAGISQLPMYEAVVFLWEELEEVWLSKDIELGPVS